MEYFTSSVTKFINVFFNENLILYRFIKPGF